MQSEPKDRKLANEQELGTIEGELVHLSFVSNSGKHTEIKPAPCVWLNDLLGSVIKHLEENTRYKKMLKRL